MPCVRAVATRRARPALASQAEKARTQRGAVEKLATSDCKAQRENAVNRDSIMPSKQIRAERRCVR